MSKTPLSILQTIQEAKKKKLGELDLSAQWESNDEQRIMEFPVELLQLDSLKILNLRGNLLASIPAAIANLKELRSLDLSHNKLTGIPDALYSLSNLETLILDSNLIRELSPKILQMEKLKELYLNGNPLAHPPPEIIATGLDFIKNYFRNLQGEGTGYLYEAKLVIVGEAGAGKSTLASKIKNSEYLLREENTTVGTEVSQWQFPMENGQSFRLNIWDFGGQEIYHATHQFFLTKRSIYLLLIDTRREDTDFFYWLNIIEALGGNSPVLIVKNEKQDRYREINERQLRGRFPNLKETIAVNLATNRGLNKLLSEIKHYALNLAHAGTPLPISWIRVKKALEDTPRDFISLDEYFLICEKVGITNSKDCLQVSSFLHDLGVCLHFQDDSLLRDVVILNPLWGTSAVYKVLDNPDVIRNHGKFDKKLLAEVWDEPKYVGMRDELLQLMIHFALCYNLTGTESYIAPQLLAENEPDYKWDETDNLIIRYTYEFLPKGIISRLIVRLHELIAEHRYVWRTGLILEKEQAKAEVIQYESRREIRVRVAGKDKKELLGAIMYELDSINSSFNQLKVSVLIPCNCSFCITSQEPYFYPFDILRRFIEDKQEVVQCQRSYSMVSVKSLINDLLKTREVSEQIDDLPVEVVNQGLAAINTFLEQSAAQGLMPLYEAKLLIVGEPGAGKTSLVKKLIDPNYRVPNNDEESTLGIDVYQGWPFPYPKDHKITVKANMWDFGGQQIQYMIHQFFLTSNSLYVLVVDDRKQHTEFDYWFNIIYLLGEGSPVLVVLNERRGQPVTNFDVKTYRKIYGDDLLIISRDVNLAEDDGRLEATRNEIQRMLAELKHIGEGLPPKWIKIRQELEKRKAENHIAVTEYFKICAHYDVAEELVQLSLSKYLHNLGIILHFQGETSLSDFVILNPQWAVDAVYSILSERKLKESGGRFDKEWLFNIWAHAGYSYEERNKLLSLMQKDKFELCYKLPFSTQDEYIAPQLLPSAQPSYDWDANDNLQFRFQYPFMPKGIITRLIVRLHTYIEQNTDGAHLVWESGVIFTKEDTDQVAKENEGTDRELSAQITRAEIIENVTKDGLKVIDISVSGAISKKKELLTIIREEIKKIHLLSFKKISSDEMIPCHCSDCKHSESPNYFPYDTLGKFTRLKIDIQCHKSGDMLNPWSLIDDVVGREQFVKEEQGEGRAVEEKGFTIGNVEQMIYQNVRGDSVMEKKVRQEKVIQIGDNASISAPIVVADTIENSFNYLKASEINDDVKLLLDQLLKAVTEVSKSAVQDNADEVEAMVRDAEALVKEATSSKPRRKWYEVSLEGLKQAAITIGGIAMPILEIVNKLHPILLP